MKKKLTSYVKIKTLCAVINSDHYPHNKDLCIANKVLNPKSLPNKQKIATAA